jgi:UDP-3-O-[3-hydroxymyristoyl] glucosamine N-acyltransferase
LKLHELAEHIGAQLHLPNTFDKKDPEIENVYRQLSEQTVECVASLDCANNTAISFFNAPQYRDALINTQAVAVIIAPKDQALCPVPSLLMDNPYVGYARAAQCLNPEPVPNAGIHPSAWVSPLAHIDETVHIAAHVSIEANVHIAAHCIIEAGTVIESDVHIDESCHIHANVTLCKRTRLGQRVTVYSGAVLGADGFGLAQDKGKWLKIPQLGGVLIGDDVDIGANTTIDKGALGDTIIANQVKLDNQIQIAHNVKIGEQTAIAGCVGIAGSAEIGARCLIGGGVGIVGHIKIVDDVHVTGGSTILQSISEAGLYSSGAPLQNNKDWHRNYIRFKQLDTFSRRLRKIEQQLEHHTHE